LAPKFCTKNALIKCWWNWDQLSISSTFYTRVFCTKFWRQKESKLKYSFVIFGANKKCARKMLVKLRPAEDNCCSRSSSMGSTSRQSDPTSSSSPLLLLLLLLSRCRNSNLTLMSALIVYVQWTERMKRWKRGFFSENFRSKFLFSCGQYERMCFVLDN